jgi:hypothetical protein
MKNFLFLALGLFLFSSCQTAEVQEEVQVEQVEEVTTSDSTATEATETTEAPAVETPTAE